MNIICKNCDRNVNKPDISKYNNDNVCLNCFIFLNGINCNGSKFENHSEKDIINILINNISYKNSYFHFYYKLENEMNYKKRLFKFNKINLNELYNNGWEIYNRNSDFNNNILIYRGNNYISLVSISCVFIYLINNKYVLKLYDIDNLDSIKYLNYFINNKIVNLKPFVYLYE